MFLQYLAAQQLLIAFEVDNDDTLKTELFRGRENLHFR